MSEIIAKPDKSKTPRIKLRRAGAIGLVVLSGLGARDVIREGIQVGNDVSNFVGSTKIHIGSIDPNAAGHIDTQKELAALPQKTVNVQPGEGVDTVIGQVDGQSGVFSNGQELQAMRDYINGESPTGEVQPGPVSVPVLPKGK